MSRIAVVAASSLLGEGVKTVLVAEGGWHALPPVRHVEDVDGLVDAVVAVASDAREAASLHRALAGRVPLVLLGDVLPGIHSADMPVALLPGAASAQQLRAAVQAVLAGLHA